MNSLSRICSIYVQEEVYFYIESAGNKTCIYILVYTELFHLAVLSFHISEIKIICSAGRDIVKLMIFSYWHTCFPITKYELYKK